MPTVTIPGVELVSTGRWAASTGTTDVTRDDLQAMLDAHADGVIDHAPVKLGHRSELNGAAKLGDAEPAYGWVVPRRIVERDGKTTLVGDLVGVPAKLAEVMGAAYRRRSVEIGWRVKAGGKAYSAALAGVALLGVTPPAVKSLADVVALYSDGVTPEATSALLAVEGLDGNLVAVAMLAAADAAGAEQALLDRMATAAGAADTAPMPTGVPDPPETDPAKTPTTPVPGGPAMPMTDEQLRAALQLEQDADVNAAIRDLLTSRTTDPAVGPTDPAAPAVVPPAAVVPPVAPVAPAVDPAQVVPTPELATLSADTLRELQADAAYARQLRQRDVLDGAVRTGRISPAERTLFAAKMAEDETFTTTLLAELAPRFAVSELGSATAGEVTDDAAEAAWTAWETRGIPSA